MNSIDVEWDAVKARANLKKHGVCFEDAAFVFCDPYRIEAYDGREDYDEERWTTIGAVHAVILFVVYTVRRGEVIRIISARKASAHERQTYREKID